MTTDDVRRLFAYSRWATARLLHAAGSLDQGALDRPLGTSCGNLRGTIAHLYRVEQLWLQRWRGASPQALPTLDVEPLNAAEQRWRPLWDGQDAYVRTQSSADLASTFTYRNQCGASSSVNMEDMLVHVANHGTYHRGQIAAAIRQLGGEPASTDFLLFAKESRRQSV